MSAELPSQSEQLGKNFRDIDLTVTPPIQFNESKLVLLRSQNLFINNPLVAHFLIDNSRRITSLEFENAVIHSHILKTKPCDNAVLPGFWEVTYQDDETNLNLVKTDVILYGLYNPETNIFLYKNSMIISEISRTLKNAQDGFVCQRSTTPLETNKFNFTALINRLIELDKALASRIDFLEKLKREGRDTEHWQYDDIRKEIKLLERLIEELSKKIEAKEKIIARMELTAKSKL